MQYSADIVVIGAGLAGHVAAVEAAEAGAKVLVLEKLPTVGGSTLHSGGSFAFAGTPEQQAEGIADSVELLRSDLRALAKKTVAHGLIEVYVENQLAAYEFLRSSGVEFSAIQFSSGQSVPRSHPASTPVIIELLNTRARKAGVEFLTSAKVLRLKRDPETGNVNRLTVDVEGQECEIGARDGVVLATGGFAKDKELFLLFAPQLEKTIRLGGPGSEGDGIKLAWEHGASIADIDALVPTFGALYEEAPREPNTILLPMYRGGIIVNRSAQRFIDESKSYKAIGDACLDEEGVMGFQIFDQAVMDLSAEAPRTVNFKAAYEKGWIVKADTIEELAHKLGLDSAVLTASVERYNADIRAGEDKQFGREHLAAKVGKPFPLDNAPFYGEAAAPFMATTYAGLKIDTDMRVIDVWNKPIGGLYAAGEVVGGLHGKGYMTGTAIAKAVIFGRKAAQTIMARRGDAA
ncbi:FAD-dependent oxidoreductase [Devosia sp. A369]